MNKLQKLDRLETFKDSPYNFYNKNGCPICRKKGTLQSLDDTLDPNEVLDEDKVYFYYCCINCGSYFKRIYLVSNTIVINNMDETGTEIWHNKDE